MSSSKVVMKGGVWKNTEDEILKVAVMKYGKNQWARIASLLVRKTPKQCKARWYEWIDPSIRKTEWSREEEEKLLHLAKIMPTQWRTIAPIVGRTPAQCLEHYEKLLDAAQGDEGAGEAARKLRPGEVDPDPETKPARPDPVDMDEDEKEMLSEARARLANTQGKKAKRKARERQLEEARRLASIQKRREMKAAGIFVRGFRKRKRDMNYNTEIPFEKRAPAGFHEVAEEKAKRDDPEFRRLKTSLSQAVYHGEGKLAKEAEARRQDIKKLKEAKEKGQAIRSIASSDTTAEALEKMEQLEQVQKRPKLLLPNPQVSDQELDQIVKIGLQGEEAKSAVDDERQAVMDEYDDSMVKGSGFDSSSFRSGGASISTPSSVLLSSGTPLLTPRIGGSGATPSTIRTPMLPKALSSDQYLKTQAQDILAYTQTQTPLKGGENTPLHVGTSGGSAFEGIATPKRFVPQTPNVVLGSLAATATAAASTPFRTPGRSEDSGAAFRDQLNINVSRQKLISLDPQVVRDNLRKAFAMLPEPLNDFEVAVDEDSNESDNEEDSNQSDNEEDAKADKKKWRLEKDADDVKAERMVILAEQERKRLARRSSAVKKGLPRPLALNASIVSEYYQKNNVKSEEMGEGERSKTANASSKKGKKEMKFENNIDRLLCFQTLRMIQHDAAKYPLPGMDLRSFSAFKYDEGQDDFKALIEFDELAFKDPETFDEYMKKARACIESETRTTTNSQSHETFIDDDVMENASKAWDQGWYLCAREKVWKPRKKKSDDHSAKGKKSKSKPSENDKEDDNLLQLESLKRDFQILTLLIRQEAKRSKEIESQVQETLSHHDNSNDNLETTVASQKTLLLSIFDNLRETWESLVCYERLFDQEQISLPIRIRSISEFADILSQQESQLQQQYSDAFYSK